jgi:hypothetical protein
MPVKTVLRAAAALVLALGALVGASLPASATPTPTATATPSSGVPTFVEYTGNTTNTAEIGGAAYPGSFPSHIRIDCSSGECVVTRLELDDTSQGGGIIDMSQGQRLVLVDGKGSFSLPALGDLCGAFWISAGVLTIDATPTGFTGVRTSPVDYQVDCPGGGSVESPPYVATAIATLSGGNPCVLDSSCPTPTPTPVATAIPIAAGAVHPSSTTHFSSPSTLSALPTVKKALTVHGALWAAAITVVLVLLIAFPTHLLNSATSEGATRAKEWWTKRRPKALVSATRVREVEYRGWPFAAGGVLLASLISSFVDPTFGFNGSSVRVYLSILVSFLLDAVAGWFLLIYLVRRARPHTTASFHFSPASLIVVAAAVIFTRLTGFAPGIIFGLVAGVAFGTVLATTEKARVALVGLGYSFVVAVIGWVGYSALAATAGAHPNAGEVFLSETLSSMAIGGIAALPIALIPIRGLTGYDVFRWNRWVWGSAYGIGLLGFFIVLMPLPFSWTDVHINLVIWIAVYIAYGLVAIIAWLVLTRPWKKPDAPADTASPESA